MKRLLFIFILFISHSVLAQQSYPDSALITVQDDSTLWQTNKAVFQNLETNRISSGILLDYGYQFTDITKYDGVQLTNDNILSFPLLEQINSTLFSSTIRATGQTGIKAPQDLYNAYKAQTGTNRLALSGIVYQYQQFDATHPDHISVVGNQLFDKYDESATWLNPYIDRTVCAVTLPTAALPSKDAWVCLPASLWQSNMSITSIAVDAADGSGIHVMALGDSFQVHYTDTGKKVWNFDVTLQGGTILHAHSSILITARTTAADEQFTIAATEPYLGSLGHGIVRIQYAHSDHVMRKPLIVVEGFDPGNIIAPHSEFGVVDEEDQFMKYIADFSIPSSNKLKQDIYISPQYDLVFVDWTNGTDYLERNALVLEEIIREVNRRKVGTAPNMVWGQSMGGVISRYALKDMENKGQPHQVSLFINHDGPQQGAHVPLGYIAMSDHLRSYWLGTGYLADAYTNIYVPLTGALSVSDALSIAFQPAAAEMLISNTSKYSRDLHTTWQAKLKTMGYPSLSRNITISNGSECGMDQPVQPGAEQFSYKGHANTGWLSDVLLAVMPLFPGATAAVSTILTAIPPNVMPPGAAFIPGGSSWDLDFWVHGDNNDGNAYQLYHGKITYTKTVLWFMPITVTLTAHDATRAAGNYYAWETFAGGYYSADALGLVTTGGISGGSATFGSYSGTLNANGRFCFIPTASALDIGSGNVSLPVGKFRSLYSPIIPSSSPYATPFSNFITAYTPSDLASNNEPHISVTNRNADFAGNELAGTHYMETCAPPCFDPNGIYGANSLCAGNSSTYNIVVTNTSPSPTLTWCLSTDPPGIATLSGASSSTGCVTSSSSSCTVNATGSGIGTLYCYPTSTCTVLGGTSTTLTIPAYTKTISLEAVPNPADVTITFGYVPLSGDETAFHGYTATISPYDARYNYDWHEEYIDGPTPTVRVHSDTYNMTKWNCFLVPTENYDKVVVDITNDCGEVIISKHMLPDLNRYICEERIAMTDSNKDGFIKVAPNPSKNNWNVSFSNVNTTPASLQLFDITGRQIFEQAVTAKTSSVVLHNEQFKSGIYVLKVTANTGVTTFRLIKE